MAGEVPSSTVTNFDSTFDDALAREIGLVDMISPETVFISANQRKGRRKSARTMRGKLPPTELKKIESVLEAEEASISEKRPTGVIKIERDRSWLSSESAAEQQRQAF